MCGELIIYLELKYTPLQVGSIFVLPVIIITTYYFMPR